MTDPVPRETPPAPAAATGVFGSLLPVAESYVALLATDGTERGLIGPREIPRLWDRHVLNCAVLADLIPEGRSVADVGSGAGLPGLVLAIRRPDLQVTLIEPLLRRAQFLEEAVARLGLASVTVRRARAEELAAAPPPGLFDVVTSRALAPLPRLLEWSLPLVSSSGELLAIKGRSAGREIEQLGLPDPARGHIEVIEVGESDLVVPTTVVRVDSALRRHIGWDRSRGGVQHRRPGSRQRRRR